MTQGENLSTARARFESAYRQTTYHIHAAKGPVDIRIGVRNTALDRILDEHAVSEWVFVTASNPASQNIPEHENARRNAELEDSLRKAGRAYLQGIGEADNPGWQPERSYLVLGVSKRDAIAMAKRWGQYAVVWGTRGRAPELLWAD